MARISLKYATPKVFNIDQSQRRLIAISAQPAFFPGNILRITFDREVDGNSAAEAEDFLITLSGGPVTPASDAIVYGGENYIDLVLSRPFLCGETGTVTYTRGTYRIFSIEGWQSRAFTLPITNINACTTTSTTTTEGFEDISYGLLYNWYAATDVREISSSNEWRLAWPFGQNGDPADPNDSGTLIDYLDPGADGNNNIAGGKMKEVGFDYWLSPNTGATNETGFNGKGSGYRRADGTFAGPIEGVLVFWQRNTTLEPFDIYSIGKLAWDITTFESAVRFSSYPTLEKAGGASIRLIRNSTTLTHGQTGTYTGNDGKVYRTICIGTQEWLADNLAETKYRDGSDIPEVTGDATWAALTTGALCAYNNDHNNV